MQAPPGLFLNNNSNKGIITLDTITNNNNNMVHSLTKNPRPITSCHNSTTSTSNSGVILRTKAVDLASNKDKVVSTNKGHTTTQVCSFHMVVLETMAIKDKEDSLISALLTGKKDFKS
eukprot:PhF_6_TR32138/c1_g1_i1/m.47598